MTATPLTNWAGNLQYSAARLHAPTTVEQVQEIVAGASRVKALGTRHSFNRVADTSGDLIALTHLDGIAIDPERRTVTIGGGVRYGELGQALHRAGWALPNLASLPHISVAGACATATHGSGDENAMLATSVAALDLVAADGTLHSLSREADGERFDGAVVGLGALGLVTALTLDIVPSFDVWQEVYEYLPLAALDSHFDAITASAYSVSLFTDWRADSMRQIWQKQRADRPSVGEPGASWLGATPATGPMHPIAGFSPGACTPQQGQPGPWHERLPHFRLDFTPSAGHELQSEYLVPRHHARAAVRAIAALGDAIAPHLQVSEIRTIAADTLWMSPCYRQPCVGFHFTWQPDWPGVRALLPEIEAVLAPFAARPHWGKLFTKSPEVVASLFPRLPDFRTLAQQYDSQGKFRNAFLDRYLWGSA